MEDTNIKPVVKTQPKIVAKVSNIGSILKFSDKAKKSSLKLRRTFEKGIYQKRTQLSVLAKYKKRLDLIELEEEKKSKRRSRKKIKLLDIKKFAGNFFSAGSYDDPFKAIGALSAFNAATKAASGDWLGAFGPALIAGGAFLGPPLLGMGVNKLFNRGGKIPRGFDKFGRRVSKSTQQRYAQRYGDKAFRNRFGNRNLKNISSSKSTSKLAGKGIQKALGRFGKVAIPGLGAYFSAQDAKERDKEGDIFGSKVSNISAVLSGTAAGLQLAAGAAAATGIGLPAAAVIEAVAGSAEILSFGLDAFNLIRDVTGQSDPKKQLKTQTEKQKEIVKDKTKDDKKITFTKTLDSYENVIDKFEQFSKSFNIPDSKTEMDKQAAEVENLSPDQSNPGIPGEGFRGQVSQYYTGDPNDPGYDKFHGGGNYHDHFAFKDRATAEKAYKFLTGNNINVTEFQGYGKGVTGEHSGRGSLHHRGLAFDVPGYQWGGTGAIGPTEYRGSARVRALMNQFFALSTPQKRPDGAPITPNTGQLPKMDIQIGQPQPQQRNIAAYTQYAPSPRHQQVIPVPLPMMQQSSQPTMMQQNSSALSLIQGPSEEEVLNSFYKRVLLNTLQ